jgi:catechol 2,3-dioxygenase-like lactoylglutathione lyase family enzyme
MTHAGPVGRFLHVNLNTRDVDRSGAFYEALGGLKTVMRTKPVPTRGEVFGMDGIVLARAHFLYDHRGARRTSALELVQWDEPATEGAVYEHPSRPGLHALCLTAEDPAEAARFATEAGGTFLGGSTATVVSGDCHVVRDVDGVVVEIAAAAGASTFAGVRLHCTDLERTMAWYRTLGFVVRDEPGEVELGAVGLGLGESAPDGPARALIARMALPEDVSFVVAMVQLLDPEPVGDSYPQGNHVGLFRSAMRVEDIAAACAQLVADGVEVVGPKAYKLAGTKVGDMKIAFVTDPDGVLAELIERPASLFR